MWLRCARPLKPATVLFEGDDPRAYIIASNIACRHMSKGQQAMAVAMMYPEPAKTKRKRSGSLEAKELGISGARIYSCLCRRVVDLHKPGQLGGIGIRLGPGVIGET
jgi:hypothetical protein